MKNEAPSAGRNRGFKPAELLDSITARLPQVDLRVSADIVLTMLYLKADAARWARLVERTMQQDGTAVVEALAGSLPEGYTQPEWVRSLILDNPAGYAFRHGAITAVREIDAAGPSLGNAEEASSPARDFSLILETLADREGIRGGEFSTPETVVEAMVGLLAPGRDESLYDPCCKSGDLLAGAVDFAWQQSGGPGARVAGQSLAPQSRRFAWMNLALRGASAELGHHDGNALQDDVHRGRRFDVVISNPPFNMTWQPAEVAGDERWRYALPPAHNANFAWVQHAVDKVDEGGRAGILMPHNAGMSENPVDRAVRVGLLNDDLIDCMITLPPQLFAGTAIPVTMWILDRSRRKRRGQVLFIDATDVGAMVRRTRRAFSPAEVGRLADTYHRWRAGDDALDSTLAAAVLVDQLLASGAVLNPRARVNGISDRDGAQFDELAIRDHRDRLAQLGSRAKELDVAIDERLARLPWKV